MRWILGAFLGVLLSAAAQGEVSPLALKGLNAQEAMEVANAWKGADVTSFVTPEAVHFGFADGKEVAVALPEDLMVVSVAPYLNHTHPCQTHFMSGCQGELVEVPVRVLVTAPDGTILVDEVMTTLQNGFIDLWLPRALELNLRLEALDHMVEGLITTYGDSNTCITTFQLADVVAEN